MASIAVRSRGRMQGNGRIMLAALAFGLLTAALVVTYLRNQEKAQTAREGASIAVVVATKEIAAGATISSAMLDVKLVTPELAIPAAYPESGRVIGLRARFPITEGAQISPNMMVQGGAACALSCVVPAGMRAFTIAGDEVISGGGHIRPGDFVDVLLVLDAWRVTGAAPTSGADRPRAVETVLQGIEVLAVSNEAQTVSASGPDPKATKDDKDKKASSIKSITLSVNPTQAQELFLAESIGKLRLSLRPFGEAEEAQVSTSIEPAGRVPAARATPAAR